ncbi:substrate-binding domain-containing protein [Streptomyces sp. NPDC005349]|uniref:substrate-binding domain-containing protein n=1 Tax=unclassified Streptomyces TaxID=2593676 RepID=UPI0033B12A1E
MGWLKDAQNLVAIATTVLSIAASLALWYVERRKQHSKRIGHRIQMDIPLSRAISEDLPGPDGLIPRRDITEDTTLVLLRIENDGAATITDGDYISDPKGLTVTFAGRRITDAYPVQPALTSNTARQIRLDSRPVYTPGENSLLLPPVALNSGDYYKLLVMLRGGGAGTQVDIEGRLNDGTVHPNQGAHPDDKPPLFSALGRWTVGILGTGMAILLVLATLPDPVPQPRGCASGSLTLTGSSAFRPAMEALRDAYTRDCDDAKITVATSSSGTGVRQLLESDPSDSTDTAGDHSSVMAFSDGPTSESDPEGKLHDEKVAAMAFALVVNDAVVVDGKPLTNLTVSQVRRLYLGDITDWKDLGGPDLPVRTVRRTGSSGTRGAFEARVLGRPDSFSTSSRDCRTKDLLPASKVLRCEEHNTPDLLDRVARVDGTIGYAAPPEGTPRKGSHILKLNGLGPSGENIRKGYPFHAVEYAYTIGNPEDGSLADSFLDFLTQGAANRVIARAGHLSCTSPDGSAACRG